MNAAKNDHGAAQVPSQIGGWYWIAVTIAICGILLSIYATTHHLEVLRLGHTDAACNISATFNCDAVALSKFSSVGGIPLGVLGVGYFTAILTLLGLAVISPKSAREHLHGYGALVVIGVLTSLVLAAISIFYLGHLCPSCVGVYTLTFLQFGVLVAGRRQLRQDSLSFKTVSNGGMSAAIVVALVIAAYNFLKPATNDSAVPGQKNASETASIKAELAPKPSEIPLTKSQFAGLGEDYRRGSDSAKVVLVEFADFECPACAGMARTLDALHQEFGDNLLIVFRNYPLDGSCNSSIQGKMHLNACKAAIMSRCAGQYGQFWQYFDKVYLNQKDISEAKLKEWAKDVGLTPDQINTCWDSKDILDKIKDDVALGNKLGVDSTPTLYVNGRKVLGGRGIDGLRQIIGDLLR